MRIKMLILAFFTLLFLVACSDSEKTYTVTFVGFNDQVMKTEEVKEGNSATPPIPGSYEGYVFVRWEGDYTEITSNTTIRAIYNVKELKVFTVIFLDKDGHILKIEEVLENDHATEPDAPVVSGYKFIKWDTSLYNITRNTTIRAIYEEVPFRVSFYDMNFNLMETFYVFRGETVIPPIPYEVEGYVFIGWDKDFSEVENDLDIKAIYESIPITYNVTFLNKEGEVIKVVEVREKEDAIPPTPPSVYGYTFIGWDENIDNVIRDITTKAVYDIKKYNVNFYSDNVLIEEQEVNFNEDAIAPNIERPGYTFIGWDQDLTNINRNLNVNAIWEKVNYASYLEDFNFTDHESYNDLLNGLEVPENLEHTFSNVKHGGVRGTNELVYYDESLNHNTNIYGLEIAVDSNGLVIEKATKVTIPAGGFVLSGHGTSLTAIDNNTKIGDYITYNNNVVKVYRNNQVNNVIKLAITIDKIKAEIISSNNNLYALDYVGIEETYNEAVGIFNGLLDEYNYNLYNLAEELLLTIDFMLIEPKAATVRAIWHYPIRSSGYTENNTFEVGKYLDKVKSIGINRVYVNTNFNGSSIYSSEYLTQRLTASYTYSGYKDYLEAFIGEAHKRGIEVYAWTNTLIAGDGSNNSFYSSKGWILKGYNDEDNHGGMYFVDISNDDVQTFLGNVFNELASNYDLDGIEYDFIRYPVGNLHSYSGGSTASLLDWGHTPSFTTKFMEKYNLTGNLKDLIITDELIKNNWLTFKRDMLTDTTLMISNTIKNANPNIKISAAVMTSLSGAKNTYLQDWEKWITEGFVEELNPMIYTADNLGLSTDLTVFKSFVKDYADIVVGIFPEGSGGDYHMVAEQFKIAEGLNVTGVAKFSSRQFFGTPIEKAFSGLNRSYITLPNSTNEELFNAYVLNLKEKIEGYYIHKLNDPNFINLLQTINSFNEQQSINDKLNEILNLINLIENQTVKDRLITEHTKIINYLK